MADSYSIVSMHHFFIHSSLDGHLSSFHIMCIVNNVLMNIWMHMSFEFTVLDKYPEVELQGTPFSFD